MSMISNINPLTGVNPPLARDPATARPTPPDPATVESAVAQPLTTPQSAVNQSPNASNAEWQRSANPDGQQQNPPAGTTADREQLIKALDQLNQSLGHYDTNLRFDIDDQSQTMVVRIVDQETHEVVRQIPSEKALAVARYFKELEAEQLRSAPKAGSTDGKGSSHSKTDGLGLLLQAIA
ncbi:MAG: flagellar protein FlaG [Candidatus Competibacteraceae bacterium]|nr:flagellar protein FlaG [Candidatus Competibacteraceae bacterium]